MLLLSHRAISFEEFLFLLEPLMWIGGVSLVLFIASSLALKFKPKDLD